jgi:hypothetical protein
MANPGWELSLQTHKLLGLPPTGRKEGGPRALAARLISRRSLSHCLFSRPLIPVQSGMRLIGASRTAARVKV